MILFPQQSLVGTPTVGHRHENLPVVQRKGSPEEREGKATVGPPMGCVSHNLGKPLVGVHLKRLRGLENREAT